MTRTVVQLYGLSLLLGLTVHVSILTECSISQENANLDSRHSWTTLCDDRLSSLWLNLPGLFKIGSWLPYAVGICLFMSFCLIDSGCQWFACILYYVILYNLTTDHLSWWAHYYVLVINKEWHAPCIHFSTFMVSCGILGFRHLFWLVAFQTKTPALPADSYKWLTVYIPLKYVFYLDPVSCGV